MLVFGYTKITRPRSTTTPSTPQRPSSTTATLFLPKTGAKTSTSSFSRTSPVRTCARPWASPTKNVLRKSGWPSTRRKSRVSSRRIGKSLRSSSSSSRDADADAEEDRSGAGNKRTRRKIVLRVGLREKTSSDRRLQQRSSCTGGGGGGVAPTLQGGSEKPPPRREGFPTPRDAEEVSIGGAKKVDPMGDEEIFRKKHRAGDAKESSSGAGRSTESPLASRDLFHSPMDPPSSDYKSPPTQGKSSSQRPRSGSGGTRETSSASRRTIFLRVRLFPARLVVAGNKRTRRKVVAGPPGGSCVEDCEEHSAMCC